MNPSSAAIVMISGIKATKVGRMRRYVANSRMATRISAVATDHT